MGRRRHTDSWKVRSGPLSVDLFRSGYLSRRKVGDVSYRKLLTSRSRVPPMRTRADNTSPFCKNFRAHESVDFSPPSGRARPPPPPSHFYHPVLLPCLSPEAEIGDYRGGRRSARTRTRTSTNTTSARGLMTAADSGGWWRKNRENRLIAL